MDEHTAIIRNIVYARDAKIFDSKTGHVNQRQAFTHENFLDIKGLIWANQVKQLENADKIGVPRP